MKKLRFLSTVLAAAMILVLIFLTDGPASSFTDKTLIWIRIVGFSVLALLWINAFLAVWEWAKSLKK